MILQSEYHHIKSRGVVIMEHIVAFEAMLKAVLDQSEAERQKMEELRAQGKE